MTFCFATSNQNKVREVQELVGSDWKITTPLEHDFNEEIAETGATIRENAEIKAKVTFNNVDIPCFADDTGLEVEALDGAPGVYSARYAGDHKNASDNIDLLLKNLKGKANRSARFVTGICYTDHAGTHYFEGVVTGEIINSQRGSGGFGYDPVFVPEGYDITFAEMSLEEKNKISHRARAFQQLADYLHTLRT